MTVCIIHSFRIFPMELFFGSSTLLSMMLSNTMLSTPASVNLTPANKICVLTSSAAIFNSLYPILMHGKALPHNAQLMMAPMATTHPLVKSFSFFMLFFPHSYFFFFSISCTCFNASAYLFDTVFGFRCSSLAERLAARFVKEPMFLNSCSICVLIF